MEFNYIGKKQHPQKKAEEHRHNCWELIYNTSGSGYMVIGGKEYPFSEGSIILCPPCTNHTKIARDTFEDLYL